MKNAEYGKNTVKKYKPFNIGVGTRGLAVSTFSFPAYSLNGFANTGNCLYRCFVDYKQVEKNIL